jgi:hypothetical protein
VTDGGQQFFLGPLDLLAFGDVEGDLQTDQPAVRPVNGLVKAVVPAAVPGVAKLPADRRPGLPVLQQQRIGTEAAGLFLPLLKIIMALFAVPLLAETLGCEAVDLEKFECLHVGHINDGRD